MIPFSTWREAFRIPWLRENHSGFRFLHELVLLQLVLYRSGRMQEFLWTQRSFFEMAHSFAQYGRREAADTVARLLAIPWFRRRRRALLEMIAAYNRVIAAIGLERPGPSPVGTAALEGARADVEAFVDALKRLTDFDARDEARVRRLMERPRDVEDRLRSLLAVVGAREPGDGSAERPEFRESSPLFAPYPC